MIGTWLPETCWATIRREIKNTKSDIELVFLIHTEMIIFHGNCKFCNLNIVLRSGVGRDSSVSIVTLRAERSGDRIPLRGGEIFRTRPDWPWGPPSLLYTDYRVFTGGKAAGTWGWLPPPPPSSAAAWSSWSVLWWTLPLPLPYYVPEKCCTSIFR